MFRRKLIKSFTILLFVCLVASSFLAHSRATQGASSPLTNRLDEYRYGYHQNLPGGFSIILSTSVSLVLEIETPNYTLASNKQDACQSISVDGYAQNGSSGEPDLPSIGVMLGIPPDVNPSIKILSYESSQIPGKYHLCPIATPVINQQLTGLVDYTGDEPIKNPVTYARDEYIPLQPVEFSIEGMIRDQRVARLNFSPFQYNPVLGNIVMISHLKLSVDYGDDTSSGHIRSLASDPYFEPLFQRLLINYAQAKNWRAEAAVGVHSQPVRPASTQQYKIQVDHDGIVKVTYAELQSAGVPVDSIDPRTIRLSAHDLEIPIYFVGESDGVIDPGDYFLFFGQKNNTKYTDTSVYWLSWGNGNGLRMADQDVAVHQAEIPTSFIHPQHLEQDLLYVNTSPSGPQNDHWYWYFMNAYDSPVSQDIPFQLQDFYTASITATVAGLLKGYYAEPQHHTQVFINGNQIDDHYWPSEDEYSFAIEIPSTYLVNGDNTLTITSPHDGDIVYDYTLVNRFDLSYAHAFTAENDLLDFEFSDQWKFQIEGYDSETIDVFDITNPLSPIRLVGGSIVPEGSLYTILFEPHNSGRHRYLALSPTRWQSPLAITLDTPSSLKDPTSGADYIVISHGDFITATQPLVNLRADQGFRVKVVDVQDVYDEFSGGVFDPQALQTFLAYAYSSWVAPAPAYVLLVGDGHYDFKNLYGGVERIYIPPYLGELDPWIGETAADNRYVTVSGDDILPDMYIGRLPVNNVEETSSMVSKILFYDQQLLGEDWASSLTFIADDSDAGGNFAEISDKIADHYVPPDDMVEKIYYGMPPYENIADAQAAILNAINQGRLIIHYTGHGSVSYWASEELFGVGSLASLANDKMFPLFLPMTCQEGYFIWPDYPSLAESLVRLGDRGAIASWSPSGFGLPNGHDLLAQGLYTAFFSDALIRFGDATTFAKYYLDASGPAYADLIDTYNLFGDPASQLKIQRLYNTNLPLIIR